MLKIILSEGLYCNCNNKISRNMGGPKLPPIWTSNTVVKAFSKLKIGLYGTTSHYIGNLSDLVSLRGNNISLSLLKRKTLYRIGGFCFPVFTNQTELQTYMEGVFRPPISLVETTPNYVIFVKTRSRDRSDLAFDIVCFGSSGDQNESFTECRRVKLFSKTPLNTTKSVMVKLDYFHSLPYNKNKSNIQGGFNMEKVEPIRDREVIKDMLSLLKNEGKYRDYLLMTIGFNTALRISDLLNLKVKDVRNEDGEYRDHIRLREQKTGKNGRHKINEAMQRALDVFFDHNPSKGPEDYLFTTYAGQMTRQRVNQIVKDLTNRFNLEGRFASHSMRKSFGYHALRQGARTDVIQAKFNHSSRRQTLDYCGITDDDVDEIVDNLNLGI